MINMDTFQKGSIVHGLVILTSLAVLAAIVWYSRKKAKKGKSSAAAFRQCLGLTVLVFQMMHTMYWLVWRDGGFNWKESLPIHVCDLAGLLAAAALLFPARRLVAVFYFWGVGLSSLAFIIPVIEEGPGYVVFWSFWVSHFIIVGGALFFVLAEGFRPTGKDLGLALIVSAVYGLAIFAVNSKLGSNYGYIGEHSPATAFFGPWPARIPLIFAAGVLLQFFAWLPFLLHDRWRTHLAASS
ncbi:MAG: TIGR02206 family membrane protein [Phycisphaera sp.]|nr:MAG: TIGR02206 family membrane protein [Phycisphaera sp.]